VRIPFPDLVYFPLVSDHVDLGPSDSACTIIVIACTQGITKLQEIFGEIILKEFF